MTHAQRPTGTPRAEVVAKPAPKPRKYRREPLEDPKPVGFVFDGKARENLRWIAERLGGSGRNLSSTLMDLLAEKRRLMEHAEALEKSRGRKVKRELLEHGEALAFEEGGG